MSKGSTSNIKFGTAIHNNHNSGNAIDPFSSVTGQSSGSGPNPSYNLKPKSGGQLSSSVLPPNASSVATGKRNTGVSNPPHSGQLHAKPQLLNSSGLPPRYQPPPQPPVSGILKQQQQQQTSHLNKIEDSINQNPEVGDLYLTSSSGGGKSNNQFSRIVPPKYLASNGANEGGLSNNSGGGHRSDVEVQIHPPPRTFMKGGLSALQTHPNKSIEEENNFQQRQDMLKFVRKSDSGQPSPSSSGGGGSSRMAVDQNRPLQNLLAELHVLKEANQRLSDDNQELRDLCCFLDDDRQKGRKLAREWQRFGRYTASVMRQEVSTYQSKLRQLDDKQQELIRDNLELKELCLYLDEERANAAQNCTNCGAPPANNSVLRDDGDGSSSSTNVEEPETISGALHHNYDQNISALSPRNANHSIADQTISYVRSLERRIRQLEDEQQAPMATSSSMCKLEGPNDSNKPAAHSKRIKIPQSTTSQHMSSSMGSDPIINGRPEAVVRALQVLEVREQLERERAGSSTVNQMDDGEKALIREMCNVVWRKLEETSCDGIDL